MTDQAKKAPTTRDKPTPKPKPVPVPVPEPEPIARPDSQVDGHKKEVPPTG